ncbi:MAG: hypothetical protein JO110_23555 [Acetobacteraceae bacterium]|nr:hypothetical protein [Acetobacteraceae bacterium]
MRAIERATHFVLILPRRALVSDWIKREWLHARMVGKKVSPVLADPAIKRSDLLPWIRREEVYEIAEPERWRQLVRVLEGPGETKPSVLTCGPLTRCRQHWGNSTTKPKPPRSPVFPAR